MKILLVTVVLFGGNGEPPRVQGVEIRPMTRIELCQAAEGFRSEKINNGDLVEIASCIVES